MVSDMTDVATVDATLHYGEPFLPFEQLLAVLPSASHKLLPVPFKVGPPTTFVITIVVIIRRSDAGC